MLQLATAAIAATAAAATATMHVRADAVWVGTFNSAINGAATILPAELLPQLATASAVAPPPPPSPPQPGYVCARMQSGQVLNGLYDGNNVSDSASVCGTAAALLFPSFYSCVTPAEGELAFATARGGRGWGQGGGGCWNPQRRVRT